MAGDRAAGLPPVQLFTQIDRGHLRQRPAHHAGGHLHQPVLAGLRPVPALQEGVAEPSTNGTPSIFARAIATSRA